MSVNKKSKTQRKSTISKTTQTEKITPKKNKGGAIVTFLIGLFITLIIAYFSFQPKLKVYPDTYFNEIDPTSASFIFENEGVLPISNISYQFYIRNIVLYGNGSVSNIFMKTDEPPLKKLSPGQSFSDFIIFPISVKGNKNNPPIQSGDIDIEITYRAKYLFKSETILRRFITKKTASNQLKWISAKPLDDLPPKGHRTVWIYTGKREY